ncbi:MAG: 2-oxo acid dehydrogenase subunit E2 [Spirochaetota bacterium]
MAKIINIVVPDGVSGAAIVEIMQQVGNQVGADESLVAIETDKATAEVPSPQEGTLAELAVQVGDTVSSGDVIGKLQAERTDTSEPSAPNEAPAPAPVVSAPAPKAPRAPKHEEIPVQNNPQKLGASVHASPSVRQFARELGVDLGLVREPSGPKGRITFADVKGFIKSRIGATADRAGTGIPHIDLPDFRKFGQTEEQPLSKIKQITGEHLGKGWLNIPLVTHFEEADITELENFRQELNTRKAVSQGDAPKTTALAFIVRATVNALQKYPQINSSLSADGKSLIIKKYYHIGIAVDTPRGLLVPVIKNAEQLSLDQISAYIKELGLKGRAGKLGPADMEGGSFTISSLGGLGGTNFTPLVNPPEAAILGVAKSEVKPIWNGKDFVPRLILPFSISYDHRILDGGEVARFGTTLAGYLKDLRYLLV